MIGAELGFSALKARGGDVVLSPPLPGLPGRFKLRDFLREVGPTSRGLVVEALRGARLGPRDLTVAWRGRVCTARLTREDGEASGVAWLSEDGVAVGSVLSGVAVPAGIARRDGRVVAPSEGAPRSARTLNRLCPSRAAAIGAALGALGEGPRTVDLTAADEQDHHLALHLSGLPEGLAVFSLLDETLRMRASDRADRAVRELNHRVRNAMSVITALISLSAPHADDVSTFAAATLARIGALDKAYSLTGANPHEPHRYQTEVALEVLTRAIVGTDEPNVTVGETDILVSPGQATAIGLILHELATNARRHGTLTAAQGWLRIAFSRTAHGYRIAWTEGGASPPGEAEERFGLSIVRAFSANYLNGSVDWTPTRDGLTVIVDAAAD